MVPYNARELSKGNLVTMMRRATLPERLVVGYHSLFHPVYCPTDSTRLIPTGEIVVKGNVRSGETGAYWGSKAAQASCSHCDHIGEVAGMEVLGAGDARLTARLMQSTGQVVIADGRQIPVEEPVSPMDALEFLTMLDRSIDRLLAMPEIYRNKPGAAAG